MRRPAIIEVPHPLPDGWQWGDWMHGQFRQIAAAWADVDGDIEYTIWTYNPVLIQAATSDAMGDNKDPNLWRIRVGNGKFVGYADTFDEACKFISLYMMLGMHNETT